MPSYRYARKLQQIGRDLATVAESAAVMARLSRQSAPKLTQKPRR